MKVKREAAVKLMAELGYATAGAKSNEWLQQRVENLEKTLNDETQPKTKESITLCEKVRAALLDDDDIDIEGEEPEDNSVLSKKG